MRVCAGSLITTTSQDAPHFDEGCLDLDSAAMVEVTSEEKDYPVESALVLGETRGWRAADSGTQTIGLIFDQPEKLKGIALLFEETETERTQEFVLRWSSDGGRSFREIVHQQWNFSPPNTTRETEEYNVHLSNLTVLELVIVPNNQSGERLALRSTACACPNPSRSATLAVISFHSDPFDRCRAYIGY